MINYLFSNPLIFLIYLISLLAAITVHEFSHALAAENLGDPTPRLQGRLKLNPLVHIDITGLLFLFFFGFGWGKPVQFDPYNLRDPRRDAAVISIAGPIANFVLALILSLLLRSFIYFKLNDLTTISSIIFIPMVRMNIILGIFNLLPIHPLDGFKIVGGLLDEEKSKEWYSLQRYGLIFLLLMIIPLFNGVSMLESLLVPAVNFLFNFLVPGGII